MSTLRIVGAHLALVGVSATAWAESPRGYGPWKLGMSRAEVQRVSEFGPYRKVAATGGLETRNGTFDGEKSNTSFVFGAEGLRKIQIWVYEGPNLESAIAGWHRVYQFFRRTYGAVESRALRIPPAVERVEFAKRLRESLTASPPDKIVRLQLAPRPMPRDLSVFSSLFRHPVHGYYVFVYYQEP